MKCMSFSNDVGNWFESYLSKIVFNVNIENSFSDKARKTAEYPKDPF